MVSAVAGAVLLAGCAAAPHPFEPVFGTGVGPLVTRPRWEFGYLFGLIKNRSHTTLTITGQQPGQRLPAWHFGPVEAGPQRMEALDIGLGAFLQLARDSLQDPGMASPEPGGVIRRRTVG